ncbi:MAG: 2-oxo acid dehydrogenase subunit E2 [Chloroflexi bacterium]|nr:2-oxo acid dehydrogenase subunit E2 [Chloroflexota bacterium]MBP7045369.1 2-oxo acid dehydrogenase subunit E2 [Chloroflexota bacterium]
MGTKIIMPELGEGIIEATIAQWLKEEGDQVAQYEALLEIETDKVTTEATAEGAGTLLKIFVPAGETVPVGTLLAFVGAPGESVEGEGQAETAVPAPPSIPPGPTSARPSHTNGQPAAQSRYTGRISPVVSRIAAENDVNLDLLTGTGLDGRITKRDILAYVENRQSSIVNRQMPAEAGPLIVEKRAAVAVSGDVQPLTAMRRSIAEHMVRSKQTSPHVTTVFEFDFTAVASHRAAHKEQFARDNARLTFTAYLIAATVAALKEHPLVNSSWRDDGILLHHDIHLGMATALEEGLIVPVIKNADSLNLLGLARTINDLADRARQKQLRPDEIQGGTFTITNHGVSGSLFATPIINQPQCGILGVGKIEKRVKVVNDAIAIRPLAYVSFTFDHRILDGASADYFVAAIQDKIENWQ